MAEKSFYQRWEAVIKRQSDDMQAKHDHPCPECGSDNYWRVAKDDPPYEIVWKCSECGHEEKL